MCEGIESGCRTHPLWQCQHKLRIKNRFLREIIRVEKGDFLDVYKRQYYEFVEFVSSMPGMTELSSTIILAEIGINMDIFDDVKHLCSWCGLSPANNESAGKKKSVRIAKACAYLKPVSYTHLDVYKRQVWNASRYSQCSSVNTVIPNI